jgi:hypothetical protein
MERFEDEHGNRRFYAEEFMSKRKRRERATELEYLTWFRLNTHWGPAESEMIEVLNRRFMEQTGMNLPEGWNFARDGETTLDQ